MAEFTRDVGERLVEAPGVVYEERPAARGNGKLGKQRRQAATQSIGATSGSAKRQGILSGTGES